MNARYTGHGTIIATIDGVERHVPDNLKNRHRQMIADWEAAGGVIAPAPEPEPVARTMTPNAFIRKLKALDKFDEVMGVVSEYDKNDLITSFAVSEAEPRVIAGLTAIGLTVDDVFGDDDETP